MFLSGCTVWAFHCSASVKAPLCLGNSPPKRHPITVQPRGTGAKWMSACLSHDGWASLERWWMTKVAMFVSYHAEWVTMAILLLRWPLLDLCQEDKSAMMPAACWMTDPPQAVQKHHQVLGESIKNVLVFTFLGLLRRRPLVIDCGPMFVFFSAPDSNK